MNMNQLQSLFESMSLGVVYQNSEGVITSANPAAERILGLTLDQMQGRKSNDARWKSIREDGSPYPREMHPAILALKTGEKISNKIMGVFHPKQNETIWIKIDATPQFASEEKTPTGVFSTFENITEQISNKQKLVARQQSFLSIATQAPFSIQILDPNGTTIHVNQAFEKLWGVSFEDLEGYNILEDEQIVRLDIFGYIKRGFAGESLTVPAALYDCAESLKTGHKNWVTAQIFPLKDENDNIQSICIIHEDISERIAAYESLAKQQKLNEKSQELGKIGTWELDLVNNILYWTDENCRMFGVEPGTIANYEMFLDKVHPDDRDYVKMEWRAAVAGKPYDIEHRLLIDGEVTWVREKADLYFDDEGEVKSAIGFTQDVTERKQADEKIFRINHQLRTSIENMPNAYILWDKNQHIMEWNKAAETIFGFSKAEMLGKNAVDYIVPEPVRHLVSGVFGKLKLGEIANYSEKDNNIRKSGESISCEWFNTPIPDVDGNIVGILTLAQDITQRVQAEETIKRTLESLNDSQRIAKLGSWYMDLAADKVVWTEELYKIYGYDPKSPAPHYSESKKLFSPESWDRLSSAFSKCAEEGSPYELELETVKEDGSNGWMRAHGEPVRDANGVIIGLKGTAQDISHSKLAELELRDTKSALIQAQRIARTGSWEMAVNTKEIKWSPELYDILGIEFHEEPSLELFNSRVHPDDLASVHEVGSRVFESIGVTKADFRLLLPSGEIKFISTSGQEILDEKGGVIRLTGVVQDITDQKQAEQDKLDFEKQILQTQKLESLGVLAGGIAHDFNNILMGILGYADLALSDLDPIDPAREFILGIDNSTRKAAGLVKQMLAYSGKGKFSLEPIDLNHLIHDTVQMLEISISKSAVMRFKYSDSPVFLEGDPTQIRQIIMNLVINASDAVGKKSGIIAVTTGSIYCDRDYIEGTGFEAQIAHTVEISEGMYTFVEVSDTGTGMSKETIARIFEPFFTTKFTGRGLGLSAVLGIVRGHHGMVKIYSEEGKGTTFKALFPLFKDTESSSTIDGSDAVDQDWKGEGTFLIADDEEAVRAVGKHMLKKLGFDVLTAEDGREAIELFKEHQADIVGVILDLTMPHKDGAEVFREIKKLNPDAKVILSSGYNEQDATQQFVGKGLAGFLQKPYVSNELVKKIIEVIK